MPQNTNLNTKEYNDDFDASKNFYKVLFRPGYSIQSRELTTLQSILQNQIEQFGKYQFKQGQQVIPGEVSFNNRLNYVKLASVSEVAENVGGEVVFNKYDIKDLIGYTLTGLTSGVQAIVIEAAYGSETESDTIFVNYISGGDDSEAKFRQGEELEVNIANSPILTVGTDGSSLPSSVTSVNPDTLEATLIDSPAMGYASAVKVETGIYFVNGFFVQCAESLLVVDKYYSQPSAKVGFEIEEELITPEKDITLYDNARGSSNYAAPGAHRLQINLNLKALELDADTGDNFIELLTLRLGVIQKKVNKKEYNILEETLARRTYDESGDYVVDNFPIELREYWQRKGNQGLYPSRVDGTVGPKSYSQEVSEAKLVAGVGSGKAYVRGYELVNKETKFLEIDKARDVLVKENNKIKTYGTPYFNVTNIYGTVPLNSEGNQLSSYPTVYMSRLFNDGYLGYNGDSGTRKTLGRRGQALKSPNKTNLIHDYGVKTIYLKAKSPAADYSGILGTKLWYVSDLAQTVAGTAVDYVEVIGFSQLTRPDDIGGEIYLELTVLGIKRELESKFIEYDNLDFIPLALGNSSGADVKRRQLFTRTSGNATDDGAFRAQNYYFQQSGTQVQVASMDYEVRVNAGVNEYIAKVTTVTDHGLTAGNTITVAGAIPSDYNETGATVLANGLSSKYFEYVIPTNPGQAASGNIILTVPISQGNKIFPYGEIVDYSELISPTIGICKPKNISMLSRGAGFNEQTDKILSKGRNAAGDAVYNSIFKLEYFNPVFFTKLTLDSPVTAGFTAGRYITGQTSQAYAVVEGAADSSYSSYTTLHVKMVYGTFIPGETIIDESGNVLRIAKENTISHFVVTKRGSQYSQATSDIATKPLSVDGKNIDVSVAKPVIEGGKVIRVDIIDRKALNEEYVSTPNVIVRHDTSVTPTSAVVRAVLYRNTVFTYTNENVKSVFSEFGDGEINKFSADVETFENSYSSSKDVTTSSFEGSAGKKILTCLAFSGNPTVDLLPGDIVEFIDSTDTLRRNIVERITPPSGLVRGQIHLDTALREDVVNATLVRKRNKITNPENASLLFPLGFKSASSLIEDSDDTKIKYYIRRDFITTSSTSGGQITFSAQLKFGTQQFIDFRESNFLLTVLDKGNADTGLENGDIMYITGDQVSALSSGGVSITLDNLTFRNDASSASNVVLKLTATIEVTKASPKTKTAIRNKRIVVVSSGDKVIPFRGYDYDAKTADVVSYADVFGTYGTDIKVFEGSVSNPPTLDDQNNVIEGYDVTDRFTFDDGQRDTFYDVSRLVLKPGFDAPSGQVVIVFNYFEHSAGDFCTVDSYLLTGVPTTDIPYFNSPSLGRVYLADLVDFRPKVDVNSIISGFQDKALLASNNTISFNGSGGIPSATPAHDENLEFTFGFNSKQYLDRIDGVFLNKKGDFIVKKGNSSLNPSKPESPDDAIALYYLFLPAFTENVKDIRVTPIDNRRYTMRDIGKLEKRVERLEYYTTLSILEQQTFNTQIKDSVGLDRFKSGIIVDNFENHAIGNLKSFDYKCSIDTQQSVLTSPTVENSYALEETTTTNQERSVAGYQKTGEVLTLPYATQDFVSNKFATANGKINPNPFVVVQYVGDASISPSIDHWYDDTQTPNILNNDTKVFSVFVNKTDAREGYASLNNFYITNWIGTDRAFFNISSLNDITTNTEANVVAAKVSTSSNISPQNNEIGKGITTNSSGKKTVASSLQLFVRSRAIKFNLRRLKPNTKFYAFIDGRNVSRYVCQDVKYTGIPGNSLGPFGANIDGSSIKSDDNGDASGLLIFPAGSAPLQNSSWTGDINSVSYETSDDAEQLNFSTGIKTIRFTSSEEDANDDSVDSFAECKYFATGNYPNQPASIISTIPAFLKGAEGVQFIDNASTQAKPSPLSQTFRVENMDGGCFVTSVDLFFAEKSASLPVKIYLTDTNAGKPGTYVVPGSEVIKSSDTFLQIYVSGTLEMEIGEIIAGSVSGVKGTVKEVFDQNKNKLLPTLQNKVTLNNDQVYTLVISNYTSIDGSPFQPNEGLSIPSLQTYNTLNNTNLSVTIAKDSGRIVDLNISDYGEGYDSATLIIQSPQLPGGSVATANISISNGEVYNTSILLEGSGYTDAPSIILRPNGSISREAVINPVLEIDTPAVRMGVSVDPQDGQTLDSVSPTRFTFENPIYLQNNTDYTLGIETDSTDYRVWSSKLGETDISTSQVITQQPLLGSVYRSQNVDAWTEDLNQDIKFVMKRAVFVTDTPANIVLTNEDLGYELLDFNPIQTDSSSNDSADSTLFKNNNRIIRVSHKDSGFEDSGKSYVTFKQSTDVGGIEAEAINNTLFQVSNSGLNSYNITSILGAGSSTFGGGGKVLASYNRKYEKLYPEIGYLSFSDTPFNVSVKTTNIIPQDSPGENYTSYQVSDYETTFLNEEHFFDNQKVIASSFNEVKNNIDESLCYKFTFSTTKDNLSPVIDLRSSSVKCISTQIDKPKGNEVRFGRRYKLLSFYPVYKFTVTNLPVDQAGDPIIPTTDQSVTGDTSKCRGDIVKVVGSTVYVKVTNNSVYQAGETLTFGVQAYTGVAVSPDGVTRFVSEFTPNTQVEVYQENLSDRFGTKIYGKIISWDEKTETLTILEEKAPINGDYNSYNTGDFARNSSNGGANQVSDIIRVGDNLWHQKIEPENQTDTNESVAGFIEVASFEYSEGVGFTPDTTSKNSTSLSKYVTKEVTLANPATTIEVRLTANMAAQDDVEVYYKVKPVNSQLVFDDIEWVAFNETGRPDIEVIPSNEAAISGLFESQSSYKEHKYSVSDLSEFSSLAVKIVMKASNPCYTPKIQDARIVAAY